MSVIETWKKRIQRSRQRREQYVPIWAEYARLFTNAYIASRAKNDDATVMLPNGDQVKLGLVFRNIDQAMSQLEVDEIDVRVKATAYDRQLDREDTHNEAIVSRALVRSMNLSGLIELEEEVDPIKRDGLIIGHGINYTSWRNEEREVTSALMPVLEELEDGTYAPAINDSGIQETEAIKEKQTIWDNCQDEHVSPLDFLFDANAKKMSKSFWHGLEKVVLLESLKNDSRYNLPNNIEPTAFKQRDLYGENPFIDDQPELLYVRLIVIWDKSTYQLKTFIEANTTKTDSNNKQSGMDLFEIASEEFPLTFDHPDDSPFSFFIPIPANDLPFGISQIEHIKNPATEADKIRTRQANLTRQLKRVAIYNKNRGLDQEQIDEALKSPDATAVGLDLQDGEKLSDFFSELSTPSVHPDLFRQEGLAEQTVDKTSGVSAVPAGGADTATEAEHVFSIGGARINRKRRKYLAFLTETSRKHLAYLRRFAPPGQSINVMTADGQGMTLRYGREVFQHEYRLKVSPGGENFNVSPIEQKMIIETAGQLLGSYSRRFDRIFIRQILTKMGFRDIQELLEAIPDDEPIIQQLMQGAGQQGQPLSADINLNNLNSGQALREAVNAPNEGRIIN